MSIFEIIKNNKSPFIVVLCFILIVVLWMFHTVYYGITSKDWGKTSATVTSIEFKNKSRHMKYTYSVKQIEYRGTRFAYFSTSHDSTYININYNQGDIINIYINPDNFAQSVVVVRAFKFEHISMHLIIIFMLLCVSVYMIYFLKKE